MKISRTGGFEDKSLIRQMMDYDGKYKNETKVKILLLIFLMDARGRGGLPNFSRQERKSFIATNHQPGLDRIQKFNQMKAPKPPPPPKAPAPDDPYEFVKLLLSKNIEPSVILKNLKNKRPDLSDYELQQIISGARGS